MLLSMTDTFFVIIFLHSLVVFLQVEMRGENGMHWIKKEDQLKMTNVFDLSIWMDASTIF